MYFDTIFLSFKNYLDHEITFFYFTLILRIHELPTTKRVVKLLASWRINVIRGKGRRREEEGLDMNLMKRTNADARVKTEYRR